MLPAKPRRAAAPTDSASTRVHTTVDIRSPMEQRSPQSCAQRWSSSAQHSDLHRWHGKHAPVRGDVRLRGKWTTRASTPRAPTGDDTRSAHGRSATIVMPVTLERGALPLKGPLGVLVLLAGERGVRPARGTGRTRSCRSGEERPRHRDDGMAHVSRRGTSALQRAGAERTPHSPTHSEAGSSRPMFSMRRSRSSRFVNSRVIFPLRLPTSMRTGASRRFDSRLVRSTTCGS